MRVYRNHDGYIVTYTPSDVGGFDPKDKDRLRGIDGFFEFDRSGTLRGMDDQQPEGRALAAFAVHCRDFAEQELLECSTKEKADKEVARRRLALIYQPQLIDNPNALPPEHDIGGEG